MPPELLRPLLICGLVLTEVGLWQWRMVLAARGRRAAAGALGALGALLQITAINQVVTAVADPLSVGGYAVGVGVGVLLGMVAGERLTPGAVGAVIVADAPGLADGLWRRGWRATTLPGRVEHGTVDVVLVALERRQQARLHRDVAGLAPGASFTVGELMARDSGRPAGPAQSDVLAGVPCPAEGTRAR